MLVNLQEILDIKLLVWKKIYSPIHKGIVVSRPRLAEFEIRLLDK